MRPSIRISVVIWGIILLATLWYFISRLLAFKQIFFEHSGIPVTQREAADLYARDTNENRTQYIPKIIHQVFHNWHDPGNETLPEDWDKVRRTCIDLNPDFEYKLWTESTSLALLTTSYPWFLPTYHSYRHPVQRVDAIRYFILLHHGGIYLDLDNGCLAPLDPLLYYPTWITDPGRGALSNNILASAPHHPFWAWLTNELVRYNWGWGFPYVTVSYASGQWFETEVWEGYHGMLPGVKGVVDGEGDRDGVDYRLHRLMMDDREGADEWVFFTQERGGTWVNWDNLMFLWIGDHLGLCLVMVVGVVGGVVWIGRRFVRRRRGRRHVGAYEPVLGRKSSVELG